MTDQAALFDAEPVLYQMQSWSAADACTCGIRTMSGHKPKCPYPAATRSWVPMEDGAAPRHWRPVADPRAAVAHAALWSGAVYGLGIPAMQVAELGTGRVVWRSSGQYPDAGEPVAPPWQDELYARIRVAEAAPAAHVDEPPFLINDDDVEFKADPVNDPHRQPDDTDSVPQETACFPE